MATWYEQAWTVNELIEKLQELKEQGCGDCPIQLEVEDEWEDEMTHSSLLLFDNVIKIQEEIDNYPGGGQKVRKIVNIHAGMP